jgi:hypothetical protein
MNPTLESPAKQTLERGCEMGTVRIDPSSGAAGGPGGTEELDPKVMAVLTTSLIAWLAVLNPDTSLVRLAALSAPPAMAAAIAPNARNLTIVLGMIGGVAGGVHLSKTGHGPGDVIRWILVIVAVTVFSYYGAARYLRVWLEIQASIRSGSVPASPKGFPSTVSTWSSMSLTNW